MALVAGRPLQVQRNVDVMALQTVRCWPTEDANAVKMVANDGHAACARGGFDLE